MAGITAADVKALRDRTGLPMMDCKRALVEAGGDIDLAISQLRKAGRETMEGRAGRETACGRIAVVASIEQGVGAMVELLCESAPVASNEEFVALADNLAKQLASETSEIDAETLLDRPSPDGSGQTLRVRFDDLNNRIREVFRIGRMVRVDGACGGYAHHNGGVGVLLQVEGGTTELARDICMHVAAMHPAAMNAADLDPEVVEKERQIQTERARQEGKPENIIEKMIVGRMRNFCAERCLVEQPFVKDDKQTVGKVAATGGMKLLKFVHWELGKE